jgi:hypothetical protein
VFFGKAGIWFRYDGDEVCRLWKKRDKFRYISTLASGTGEWGDAMFEKLSDIDQYWRDFEEACGKLEN